MKIIEQNVVPKNPRKKSEDGIVVTDDYIAVIDGSTSKTTHRFCPTQSNGRYCMQLISQYIRQASPRLTCRQFCIGVTKHIRRQYSTARSLLRGDIMPFRVRPDLISFLEQHPEERLTASAVVYSRLNREIWLIGDCQCLIGGAFYDNPKPYETELAQKRADIIRQSNRKEDFLEHDTARNAIIPIMLEHMKGQNKTYAVIDGFHIPEEKVKVISLDFRPWEIVLASDGYPFLEETLEKSEARLKKQQADDPLNITSFLATKAFTNGNNSFDDRAYIRFQV